MGELKEALIYAVVNGFTATSVYSGSAIFFGEGFKPAMVSGGAIGMIVFGTYLIREKKEINPGIDKVLPTPSTNKEKLEFFTPTSVKRKGLFRIVI